LYLTAAQKYTWKITFKNENLVNILIFYKFVGA
jgi:hypothetical protein